MRKPAISSNDVAVGHGIVKKFAIIETADKLNRSLLVGNVLRCALCAHRHLELGSAPIPGM